MQKKKTFIIFSLAVFCIAILLFYLTQRVHGVSGNQWILKQKEQINILTDFSEDLDDVYALYISGAMDKSSFLDEWQRLSEAYSIIELQRKQQNEKNTVAPEEHTEISKKGAEAINTVFLDFRLLLNASVKDGIPVKRTELLYNHMAYSKQIQEELDIFIKAYKKAKEAES